MPLHPRAQALLDLVAHAKTPPVHDLDVDQARREFRKMQSYFRPDAPAVASVRDLSMARGADAGGPLPARCYRPAGSDAGAVLPLLVWFHGGGWTLGDVESYEVLCRELSNGSGCAVLSVEYRLAPEHPFPAAVEDAAFALAWAVREASALGIDPAWIALGGDSAGGNLATVTAIAARDAGGPPVAFQLLVYPGLDQLSERPSQVRYGAGHFLDTATVRWFQAHYLPRREDWLDWRASPLRAPDLSGLPPTLLVAAECDPLVDDCAEYARRLKDAGVAVEWSCAEGLIHGFLTLGKFFPQSSAVVAQMAAALRRALAA